jgi:catechol 2,3-dioxygenase-like lactoylglutathione lyase family enzyme
MRLVAGLLILALGGCASSNAAKSTMASQNSDHKNGDRESGDHSMRLGNFSVSLAVKNLAASRTFYEKLGFRVVNGDGKNWSILQNETSTIGLFQGMFDKNILTFNPGWDRNCATLPDFEDVREIQRKLKSQGVTLATQADETTSGPASVVLFDPDGNQILLDQHVPSPQK